MRNVYLAIAHYCLMAVKDSLLTEYDLVSYDVAQNAMQRAYGRTRDAIDKIEAIQAILRDYDAINTRKRKIQPRNMRDFR